jgi:prolyl-tRNA synthetase
MTHSDDNGLVLPPKIASKQIVIIPFTKENNEDKVLDYCYEIKSDLEKINFGEENIGVIIDNSNA